MPRPNLDGSSRSAAGGRPPAAILQWNKVSIEEVCWGRTRSPQSRSRTPVPTLLARPVQLADAGCSNKSMLLRVLYRFWPTRAPTIRPRCREQPKGRAPKHKRKWLVRYTRTVLQWACACASVLVHQAFLFFLGPVLLVLLWVFVPAFATLAASCGIRIAAAIFATRAKPEPATLPFSCHGI